ncbi:MAG: YSIRK-type signal peptide-containing protein [Lactobacillus sp.]|nr:YSIRK-type signal peptide-containing protein [Lactobacillus sp.]
MKHFRDNKQIFSLRKLSVGLCSVVLATISMGGVTSHTVKANDQPIAQTASSEATEHRDAETKEDSNESTVTDQQDVTSSVSSDVQSQELSDVKESSPVVENKEASTDQFDEAKQAAISDRAASLTRTLTETTSQPTNMLQDGALSLDKSTVSFDDTDLTVKVAVKAKQGDRYKLTIPKGYIFSGIKFTDNDATFFDYKTNSDKNNIYVELTAKQDVLVGPITFKMAPEVAYKNIMSAKDSKETSRNINLTGSDKNGQSLGSIDKTIIYDTRFDVEGTWTNLKKLFDKQLDGEINSAATRYSIFSFWPSIFISGSIADISKYTKLGSFSIKVEIPDGFSKTGTIELKDYSQKVWGYFGEDSIGKVKNWKATLIVTDPNTGEQIYSYTTPYTLPTKVIAPVPKNPKFEVKKPDFASPTVRKYFYYNLNDAQDTTFEIDIPKNVAVFDSGEYDALQYSDSVKLVDTTYYDEITKQIKKLVFKINSGYSTIQFYVYALGDSGALTATLSKNGEIIQKETTDLTIDRNNKFGYSLAQNMNVGFDENLHLVTGSRDFYLSFDVFNGLSNTLQKKKYYPEIFKNQDLIVKYDTSIILPENVYISQMPEEMKNSLKSIEQKGTMTVYNFSFESPVSNDRKKYIYTVKANANAKLGKQAAYTIINPEIISGSDFFELKSSGQYYLEELKQLGLDTDKATWVKKAGLNLLSLQTLLISINTQTNTKDSSFPDINTSILNPDNTITTEFKLRSLSPKPTNNAQMVINLPTGIGYTLKSQKLSDPSTTALYSTEYYDLSNNKDGKVDESKFKTWDQITDKSTIKSVLLQSPTISANVESGALTLTATVDNSVSAIGNKGTFSTFVTADEYKGSVTEKFDDAGSVTIVNDAKPVVTSNGDLSNTVLNTLLPGNSKLSNPNISSSDHLVPGVNLIKVKISTTDGTVSDIPVDVLNIVPKSADKLPTLYTNSYPDFSNLIDDAVKKAVPGLLVTATDLDLSTAGQKTVKLNVLGSYKGVTFTKEITVSVNVVAPTITIAYYDYNDQAKQVGQSKKFTGTIYTDQDINDSDYAIPEGYTYVSGKFVGKKQYSDNSDENLIKVLVVKNDETLTDEQGNPVTDTKTITRKISSNKEGHNNVTQTITLTGIKHKINTVTGGKVSSTEYTDWLEAKDKWKVVLDSDESATELTSTTLPSFSAEEIAGYTPDKKTIAALDLSTKTNGELDGLNTINEVITYTANPQSVKVVYENLADDTVVGTEDAVSGVTDGTATLTYDKLPAGYTIVSGNVPSYTFTADSDQKVHVKVVKDDETLTDKEGNPVTDTKTVTRKIILKKGASDYKTVTQTITLTGIKHKINTVADGKVSSTEYTDWLEAKDKWTGSLPEYVSEAIAGYTVDKKSVAAIDVTKMTNEDIDKLADSSEVITYTANPQSVQVEYKNIRDNQVVGTEDVINGVTDGTATPTYDKLPAGYTIVSGKVDSYTFTADNDQKIVVSVVPTDETVTDEQGNPVVDNKTVTRKIVLKKGKSHYKTITQTVELKGIKHKTNSVVDGQVTSVDYTDWLASKDQWTGSLPEYKVPKIKGYKADKSKVEAEDLTQKSNTDLTNLADSEVVITYTKTKKPDSGKGGSTKPNDGKKPGSGNKPGDGKKPGSGTKPGDGKKPGSSITPGTTTPGSTKPGDGKKPGSGTTTPGSTKPGDGKKPSSGTKPSDSKKPNKPTKPSDIDTTLKGAIEDAKKKQEHGSSDKDKLKQAINDAEDALKHGSKSDKKKALDNLTDLGLKSAIKSAKDTKNSINAKNISASDKDGLRKAIRDAENALKHGSRAEKNKAMNDLLSAALRLALKNAKALKNSDLYKNASSAQKARLDQAIANAEKALENGSLADKQNALDDLNGAVKDLGKQSGQNDLLKHAPLYALGAAIVAGLGWWFFLLFKRRKRDEEEENK